MKKCKREFLLMELTYILIPKEAKLDASVLESSYLHKFLNK